MLVKVTSCPPGLILKWAVPESQSCEDLNIFRAILWSKSQLVITQANVGVHSTKLRSLSAVLGNGSTALCMRTGFVIATLLSVEVADGGDTTAHSG